jgi:hypothetical protein
MMDLPPPPAQVADHLPDLASELDARVCSIHRIVGTLCAVIEGTRQESPIFNISTFETRAGAILTLRQLYMDLQKLTALVVKNGAAAEALHRAELKVAQEGLNRAQPRAADGSAAAGRPPDPAPVAWAKVAATHMPHPIPAPLAPLVPARLSVNIIGSIAIDAIVLPTALKNAPDIFAGITGGDIYYIPHWNHFAVRVGGCVLHANLGHIYRPPPRSAGSVTYEAPARVKDCRRQGCAGATCRYYHDPEHFAGSTDVRNFMADSWHYTPAASPARYGTRRIGSANEIEADLRVISLDEARRFLHQTAHDILCAAILWQHVLAPAQRQNKPRR